MFHVPPRYRPVLPGLVLIASGLLATQEAAAQGYTPPPTKVGVMEMQKQAVPYIIEVPGRAVASQQVSVLPRVTGMITQILYTPGRPLKVGDPMFQLDDASYAATVAADKASVASAEADLPLKQDAYDRAVKLKGTGYTQADVETAASNLASAKATLESAQAALTYAETQLGWTTIRSPLNGVPEVNAVSIGDLVTSGQTTALTTITQLDPIEVDVLQASSRILQIRKQIQSGVLSMGDTLEAQLTLENGDTYDATGTLVAPSATVSTTTGTQSSRFSFPNKEGLILPGMFLRAKLNLGNITAYLVPQRAGSVAADGTFKMFILGDDNKAKQISVTPTDSYENNWVVLDGIPAGAKVIIDGQKSLRDGATVAPYAAHLDKNGLVVADDAAAADAKTTGTQGSGN